MILTEIDLEAIEARSRAATPGPWYVRQLDDAYAANLIAVSTQPDTGEGERLLPNSQELEDINQTLVAGTLIQCPVRYVDIADRLWDENAAFIVRAREDVPRLVAEVRRLRALLRRGGFSGVDADDAP